MIRVVARKYKYASVEIVNQLVEMAELPRIDVRQIATFKPKVTDPFLRDAIDLLVSGFESDAIEKILKRRLNREEYGKI